MGNGKMLTALGVLQTSTQEANGAHHILIIAPVLWCATVLNCVGDGMLACPRISRKAASLDTLQSRHLLA